MEFITLFSSERDVDTPWIFNEIVYYLMVVYMEYALVIILFMYPFKDEDIHEKVYFIGDSSLCVLYLQVAKWGRMSTCDVERPLLANSFLEFSNARFILLSEPCIPMSNFTIVYKYLSRSRHIFMSAFDDHGPYGRGRYNKNMEPEVTID
jgi:hypothetical protein